MKYQLAGTGKGRYTYNVLTILFRIQIRVDTTQYEVKTRNTLANNARDTRIPGTHAYK